MTIRNVMSSAMEIAGGRVSSSVVWAVWDVVRLPARVGAFLCVERETLSAVEFPPGVLDAVRQTLAKK